GSGNKRRKRSGPYMVGHRKGGIGPGRYPVKASRVMIKLIQSCMENARHQYEDIDPEEMVITHCAAHRGPIKRGWTPRARGRASPKNHYRVNLEIFLEDFNSDVDELEDDF
ncbi:MAG: uL22 family ribosomal protein, partial [Euryarchaeota archaeon]